MWWLIDWRSPYGVQEDIKRMYSVEVVWAVLVPHRGDIEMVHGSAMQDERINPRANQMGHS